jgi:hypothetical protein
MPEVYDPLEDGNSSDDEFENLVPYFSLLKYSLQNTLAIHNTLFCCQTFIPIIVPGDYEIPNGLSGINCSIATKIMKRNFIDDSQNRAVFFFFFKFCIE